MKASAQEELWPPGGCLSSSRVGNPHQRSVLLPHLHPSLPVTILSSHSRWMCSSQRPHPSPTSLPGRGTCDMNHIPMETALYSLEPQKKKQPSYKLPLSPFAPARSPPSPPLLHITAPNALTHTHADVCHQQTCGLNSTLKPFVLVCLWLKAIMLGQ